MADFGKLADMGVKLLFFPVYMGDRSINPESGTKPFYDGFWKGNNEYDFSAADMLYRTVIGDSKPGEVYLIPRVMVEPPTFWEKEHPEALARDYAGASVHQCYSSEIWLNDTVKALESFVCWVKSAGYDAYTAGIHLAGGHTEEFMRPITHALQMTDYSEASVRAWRGFLKKKYKNSIDKLCSAWGSESSAQGHAYGCVHRGKA